MDGEARIIATSPATAEICDRLDLDLIGRLLQHDFGAAGALFGSDTGGNLHGSRYGDRGIP